MSFYTLGCRLNRAETGSLVQGFQDRGYEVVEFGRQADVVLINTCTVTDSADSTCRNIIRKAHQASPEGKLVVVGCYAQMESDRIARMQGVDLILGTSEKYKVFDYLREEKEQVVATDKTYDFYGSATSLGQGQTRAFLKIQDGCNYVCSFCIIPQARGRSRALSLKEAAQQARNLISRGFKEIVLTGVNIGEYEQASGEKLVDLVRALLDLEGLERLRLSSVEPNTLKEDLLDVLAASPQFMDHFHIPLQSGSDAILQAMKRKYGVAQYKRVISQIKDRFPRAGIGADVIAGFPGEGEEQFRQTYDLLKELPLTHLHVFPYSKRKNTLAARREDQVQHSVKKARVQELCKLEKEKLSAFSKEQLGLSQRVLFEDQNEQGYWRGYTSHFVRVWVKSEQNLKNQIGSVFFTDYQKDHLRGELLFSRSISGER